MNNTAIKIVDTVDDSHVTQDKYAKASSLILGWKGGDEKDDLYVVGSYLKFTLISLECTDGVYYDLFTGDEQRFKVVYYDLDTDVIYWQGFLLPDSYSEPYKVGPIDVSFTAVDGLGRLKGKFLPEDFYEEEKSVIEILSKCLELTGLTLDFRFAPAIENYIQKDYNLIYKDTRRYIDGEDKEDAFSILENLLKDLQCTLFQSENYFNIEGLNIRNLRVYNTKIYNYLGEFQEEVEITRNEKKVTALAEPEITMQAPYGYIKVSHEREDVQFPETVAIEKNDGWALIRKNIVHYLYATDWVGTGGIHAKAANYKNLFVTTQNILSRDEYGVAIGRGDVSTQWINLREQPYIKAGFKYKLILNFKLLLEGGFSEEQRQAYIDNDLWKTPFYLDINQYVDNDGTVEKKYLFSNYYDPNVTGGYLEQQFDIDGEKENNLEFIPDDSGLLDIRIYPVVNQENGIQAIQLTEASLETIGFEDEYIAEYQSEGEYTIKKEIELETADDSTAFSNAFRLQKLRVKNNFNLIDVNVIRQFTRDGFNYSVFNLEDANLIKENIDEVYVDGSLLEVIDVIYNYKNSEEYVMQTDNAITGTLQVKVFDYNGVTENRDYWQFWTDSLYKVEKLRYPDAVLNLYKRLFEKPIPKIDFNVKNNIKFNDFINFTYRSNNKNIITNCEVDIDEGLSNVTCIENFYAVSEGQNIPPVVEAGQDIAIGDGIEEVNLTSEAYDPDGFIVSYEWEVLTGTGAIFTNPNDNNTTVTGLTGDEYVFQVTATDNEGATATDTVTVYRRQDHNLILNETIVSDTANVYEKDYVLEITPDIAIGASLNIQGSYRIVAGVNSQFNTSEALMQIKINGEFVRNDEQGGSGLPSTYISEDDFSIPYFNGDLIEIKIKVLINKDDDFGQTDPFANAEFTIESADFVDGFGDILGTPQTRSIELTS